MNLIQLQPGVPTNNNLQPLRHPKWFLFRAAAYLGGQGITFGDPIVPHAAKNLRTGSLNVDCLLSPEVDIIDTELNYLADGQYKHLFIGPRLAMMDNPPSMLRQLANKLAPGGHLIMGQKINDKTQKFYWDSAGVDFMVSDIGRWQIKDVYERDGYLLRIYKKLHGKKGVFPAKERSGKPRACICRYGALGDMIMITPLIHQLADDGYEVTMNISPYALPVIEHNPYVHNLIIQERDMIPNLELGPYWDEWRKDYARYINLSESLEGRYLKVEGRRDFYTPKEWRIKTGEFNYYDATMRLGGYPGITGTRGEFFFTDAEERNCKKFFDSHRGKYIVLWAMNGSSHHKIYPMMEVVVHDFLMAHPDAIIVKVGDANAKQSPFEHQRLLNMCGVWGIRESLLAAKYANLVVGPETMMTNAAGSMGTPVITLLSHSTHEALCKHWGDNDYCLAPEGIECYPCFQLHYTKESCPILRMENSETKEVITEAPACAIAGIKPERLVARMDEVYSKGKNKPKNAIMKGSNGPVGQVDAITA